MARLTDYRVLTFDCYGTLIDWEGRDLGCVAAPDHAKRALGRGP